MDPVPIARLERDWRRELAGRRLAEHLRRWQAREAALRPFASPPALLRYLRRSAPGEREDAVLGALLACAREDPLAARLVLQRMLPGLKRRAGRVLTCAGEREELWSLLLANAWERIRSYPLERRPRHVAANLLLDALGDTLKQLADERQLVARSAGEPAAELAAPEPDGDDPVALLWRAMRAAAISVSEARLIIETRIDGVPLVDAAAERGVSRHALVVRRLRAEERLFLHRGYGRVTRRGSGAPLCRARVAGARSAGLAGGEDQPNPQRR